MNVIERLEEKCAAVDIKFVHALSESIPLCFSIKANPFPPVLKKMAFGSKSEKNKAG